VTVPIARLRRIAERFMTDTASISRYTETITVDGVTQDWQTVASGLPCQIMPNGSGGFERMSGAEQFQAANSWTVSLPAGTDVTVRDRLVVGARTFEVVRVDARTYEARRDAICIEVT
jgi:head-tail adaptor